MKYLSCEPAGLESAGVRRISKTFVADASNFARTCDIGISDDVDDTVQDQQTGTCVDRHSVDITSVNHLVHLFMNVSRFAYQQADCRCK